MLLSYIICGTCRLLQFALMVSVSFRALQRAAERVVHNKDADIYSIESGKSFSMDGPRLHLGACPCGSLEINLNIPNHTNCLFSHPVKTQGALSLRLGVACEILLFETIISLYFCQVAKFGSSVDQQEKYGYIRNRTVDYT